MPMADGEGLPRHFVPAADGEGLVMRFALTSLGSFATRTGILPSAFRLRVEPPPREFFIPNHTGQKLNAPLGV